MTTRPPEEQIAWAGVKVLFMGRKDTQAPLYSARAVSAVSSRAFRRASASDLPAPGRRAINYRPTRRT